MSYDLCSSRQCNVCLLLEASEFDMSRPEEKAPLKLSRCNGCRLVVYCSAEHQKLDWPLHRDLCRVSQTIRSTFSVSHPLLANGNIEDNASLEKAILQFKCMTQITLKRPLKYNEEELTSFPAYCAVCFSFHGTDPCLRCMAVSYCSEKHKQSDASQHQRICGLLELYYCPFKVHPVPDNLVEIRRYVPDLEYKDLIQTFQLSTLERLPDRPTATLNDYQLFATAADFSCIGTICLVLPFLNQLQYDTTDFVIYIIGATVEGILWFRHTHTQFFFQQYPDYINLELYFIGPEVAERPLQKVCYDLRGKQRSIWYHTYRGLFEDFRLDHQLTPSLIVAFNCGFSENATHHIKEGDTTDNYTQEGNNDTWRAAIREMCQIHNVPIVITSFTNVEAELDYDTLLQVANSETDGMEVERIFNITQNPYRDFRPCRNWKRTDNKEIYYRNGYMQAVYIKSLS